MLGEVLLSTLFMIQCNRLVTGVQYPGISSISSFLKQARHAFHLFDTAEYTSEVTYKSVHTDTRESIHDHYLDLMHRRVEATDSSVKKKPLEHLLQDLDAALEKISPDFVGISTFSDEWPFALFIIRHLHKKHPEIPIIVGGVHATIDPESVIKHAEVSSLCIGEGELPLLEPLNAHQRGVQEMTIHNMWFRLEDGSIIKNPLRPTLEFTDDTPFIDWDIYNDMHFMFPFEGKLYRRGSVMLSRGCPYACSYCVNDFYRTQLGKENYGVRNKPVAYALDELAHLKARYDLTFLRFWDETFLAKPMRYLEAFAEGYRERIGLPFTIETTASTIQEEKVKLLKSMGCQSISMGVETANEEMRRNLLNKKIKNATFEKAFRILHEQKMRYVANFMFFLPEQTLDDMYQAILFCQQYRVKYPSPRIFFPYAGSWLRAYGEKNGLFDQALLAKMEDENQITSLDDLSGQWSVFSQTVTKVSPDVFEQGKRLLDHFILLMEMPSWLHEPILAMLKRTDDATRAAITDLSEAVYQKRFPTGS